MIRVICHDCAYITPLWAALLNLLACHELCYFCLHIPHLHFPVDLACGVVGEKLLERSKWGYVLFLLVAIYPL